MTALDQVVTEGFSEEVTVEQRQRDKGWEGKSPLCKSPTEEHSRQKEEQVQRPCGGSEFGTLAEG